MSEKKLNANTETTKKKPGPSTPEGRRRSSLNARRHQLCSKVYIAPPDEMAAFDAHCKAWLEALAPAGLVESELAREIAEDKWRLKRARAIENSIFAQGHDKHADSFNSGIAAVDGALAEGKTWSEQSHELALLTVYEGRIRRAVEKNTAQFEAIQNQRKQAYAQAQRDAIRLMQTAVHEGEVYQPGDDFVPARDHGGFVYSAPALERAIGRAQRFDHAWEVAGPGLACPKAA